MSDALRWLVGPRGSAPRPAPRRRSLVAGLAAAAAAAMATASCHDATSPGFSVAVTVQTVQGPRMTTDSSGQAWITCDFTLVANTAGRGDATWEDATMWLYLAAGSRTQPVDSAYVDASTIRETWNAEGIGSDSTEYATWEMSAPVEFLVTVHFGYLVLGGGTGIAPVTLTCAGNQSGAGTPQGAGARLRLAPTVRPPSPAPRPLRPRATAAGRPASAAASAASGRRAAGSR